MRPMLLLASGSSIVAARSGIGVLGSEMHLLRWRAEMQLALKALSTIDLGYPQGDNVLWPAADRATLEEFFATAGVDAHSPLVDFYGVCAGASLPDVHVG